VTIRKVSIVQFAALRDTSVDLAPGLNLIVGPNEAGKSTLFAAIRHGLLSSTRLTKSAFTRELARYLPRPDGDSIEYGFVLESDARYELRRRWGADPQTTLRLPSGTQVSGDNADEHVRTLLTVSPGTYRTLFLVDQATLDTTVTLLEQDHGSREELLGALRNQGSGGISVDAFMRMLRERIDEHFSRWDRDREGPEQGRGIDHPWEKKVGTLLRAWYEWKREEAAVREIEQAETALEAADEDLRAAVAREQESQGFVRAHESAYEALRDESRLERELEALAARMNELRSASRRWPVLLEDERRSAADVESAQERAEAAAAAVRNAGAARKRVEAQQRLARIDELQEATAAAAERLEALPPVDEAVVTGFRTAERELEMVRMRLEAGELRARISVDSAHEGTVMVVPAAPGSGGPAGSAAVPSPDDRPERAEPDFTTDAVLIRPGQTEVVAARRQIVFQADGIAIEVETGEEPYADLVAARDRANGALARLSRESGANFSHEARAMADQRISATRELEQLREQYAELTKGVDLKHLRELCHDDDSPPAAPADESALAETLAAVREELGATQTRLESLRTEIRTLEETYNSQDHLEDTMLELRSAVRKLETQRAGSTALPEGFTDVQGFLDEFERRRDDLDALRDVRESARLNQVTMLSNLPDRTAEEARESCSARKAEFERAVSHGRALLRLEAASQRSASGESPGAEAARRLTSYLDLATGSRFRAPEVPEGRITPTVFAAATGPELEFDLLSQGTRDIVSLALRLALAEAAAPDGAPPLLLDDPLVDMDPDRRAGAVRAIEAYAEGRQVLLFTCHPDHAELFGGATVAGLPPA
jgi:DNA repair exonuclease SbcCD ATPase subunit